MGPPESWIVSEKGVRYPPAPWRLGGTAHVALGWVSRVALEIHLAPGLRPLTFFGRTLVAVVWVEYEPGGVLEYRELAAVVPMRQGFRLAFTIPHIWVDSEAAQVGGWELWAIPKRRARFHFGAGELDVEMEGQPLAHGSFTPRWRLPGRWPFAASVLQSRGDVPVRSRILVFGRVSFGQGEWRFAPNGGLLGRLPRRPLLFFRVEGAMIGFGV